MVSPQLVISFPGVCQHLEQCQKNEWMDEQTMNTFIHSLRAQFHPTWSLSGCFSELCLSEANELGLSEGVQCTDITGAFVSPICVPAPACKGRQMGS